MRDEFIERNGLPWHAIYAKHHHEKKSAAVLSRKGFDVYLPLYSSLRSWRDRKKRVELPLFPGYLFLRSDLADRLEILKTPGVFFIVASAGRVCAIPDEDIASMRALTRSPAAIEPHPFLTSGDYVCVHSGPLTGFRGILTRVKNQHRVVLCVDLLRKAVSVEIDIKDVGPASRPTGTAATKWQAAKVSSQIEGVSGSFLPNRSQMRVG